MKQAIVDCPLPTEKFENAMIVKKYFGVMSGIDLNLNFGIQPQNSTVPLDSILNDSKSTCQDLLVDPKTQAEIMSLAEILFIIYFVTSITLIAIASSNVFLNNFKSVNLWLIIRRLTIYQHFFIKVNGRFVEAFSVRKNIKKLLRDKIPEEISCLDGIRVLSMITIIFCHQYGMVAHSLGVDNYYGTKEKSSIVLLLLISAASLSVDSFFCISGLVLSYALFNGKKYKWSASSLYFRRFMRLTPPALVTAWFFATIGPRFVEGAPWASDFAYLSSACSRKWWKDLFHVTNFFQDVTDVTAFSMCNGQSWSTSVDSQLFILVPLLIGPILADSFWGVCWLYCVTLLSVIVPFTILHHNRLPPIPVLHETLETQKQFYSEIYMMPWSRSSPWIIGIWTGYLLNLKSEMITKLTQKKVVVLWFCSVGLMVQIFWTSFLLQNEETTLLNPLQKSIFGATHRLFWALGVSGIIFLCHKGAGGIINTFLSCKLFSILGKLTFLLSVISLNVQFMIECTKEKEHAFTHSQKVIDGFVSLGLSLILALMMFFLVEAPVTNLMSVWRNSNSTNKKDNK